MRTPLLLVLFQNQKSLTATAAAAAAGSGAAAHVLFLSGTSMHGEGAMASAALDCMLSYGDTHYPGCVLVSHQLTLVSVCWDPFLTQSKV